MRYDDNGNPCKDFILNKKEYSNTKILISGANFGCGSSREHAPWSLIDFGIRVIIAPSFADIFYNNCFKNSILPIILPQNIVNTLGELSNDPSFVFKVDLYKQEIQYNNKIINFDISNDRKICMINGYDDISLTLKKENLISEYEQKRSKLYSWLN